MFNSTAFQSSIAIFHHNQIQKKHGNIYNTEALTKVIVALQNEDKAKQNHNSTNIKSHKKAKSSDTTTELLTLSTNNDQDTIVHLIEEAKQDGTLIKGRCGKYKYHHKVSNQEVNCPVMMKLKSTNPLNCEIYCSMRKKYNYTQLSLSHIQRYRHHVNSYDGKSICKYGQECKAYIRSEKGVDGNKIEDQCHMALYRHPPRTRQIKMAKNIHPLAINKSRWDNHNLYKPTKELQERYGLEQKHGEWISKDNPIDGVLKALIDEVIANKFEYDLCLSCSKNDECKHDVYDSRYSILHIVDQKMECLRHKLMNSRLNRGQMLSLILYTGLIPFLSFVSISINL